MTTKPLFSAKEFDQIVLDASNRLCRRLGETDEDFRLRLERNPCAVWLSIDDGDLDHVDATMGMRRRQATTPVISLPTAKGRALTLLALDLYDMRRRWYEHAPWVGDRWLRRRLRDAWRPARVRPVGVPVEVFESEMVELQGCWRRFLGAFPRWARPALRWIVGDRP